MESANVTFRNNFVHHNLGDGIWYDGGNPNALVEGNRVEDNGRNGIFYEASSGVIIRNNTIRRSGDTGVFISTSQNAQIYNNTLENNFRGITYFVNCGAMAGWSNLDLRTTRRMTTRSASARRAARSRTASAIPPTARRPRWRRITMAPRT